MVDGVTVFAVFVVFFLMLGLGATVIIEDFKRNLKHYRALGIAALSQFGWMPLISYGLVKLFDVDNTYAIGIILIGCTPGGSTSNVFTYWSKGDVSLSITMTLCSTILAFGMMPLLIFIYTDEFTNGDDIKVDYGALLGSLAVVVVPVGLGVYTRTRNPDLAKKFEKGATVAGLIFVFAGIIYGSVDKRYVFEEAPDAVFAIAVLMLFIGASFGYSAARLAKVSPSDSRTIALETGIQNSTLTIAIITLSFDEGEVQDQILLYPLLYTIFVVIDSCILSFIFYTMATKDQGSFGKESIQGNKAQELI